MKFVGRISLGSLRVYIYLVGRFWSNSRVIETHGARTDFIKLEQWNFTRGVILFKRSEGKFSHRDKNDPRFIETKFGKQSVAKPASKILFPRKTGIISVFISNVALRKSCVSFSDGDAGFSSLRFFCGKRVGGDFCELLLLYPWWKDLDKNFSWFFFFKQKWIN